MHGEFIIMISKCCVFYIPDQYYSVILYYITNIVYSMTYPWYNIAKK